MKKQVNIRLDPETITLLQELTRLLSEQAGFAVSQADVITSLVRAAAKERLKG